MTDYDDDVQHDDLECPKCYSWEVYSSRHAGRCAGRSNGVNESINKACPKCGQADHGQTGEYPCPECGLPTLWDDEKLWQPGLLCPHCGADLHELNGFIQRARQTARREALEEAAQLFRYRNHWTGDEVMDTIRARAAAPEGKTP